MSVRLRIHFMTDRDPSPSLRCRIFGHDYVTGSARTDEKDYNFIEMEVCRRCRCVKDGTWEGIASFRADGGEPARYLGTGSEQEAGQ